VASLLTEIGGQIGWLASGMHYAFKQPVYVGDTITCELTITEIDERDRATATVTFRNQHHLTVIEATVLGVLPNEEAKRIMAVMVAEGDPTNKHNQA
jgi:acyl-CoA thioesterase FadM